MKLSDCQPRIEKHLELYLNTMLSPAPLLHKAMCYAVLNKGKRIRPQLVYATGYALNIDWEHCDLPACAIELIHAYSLVHDDLPAMDNSDLRRGMPSCHQAFDEATAILAGDALQSLAFEMLAHYPAPLSKDQRLDMISILSQAAGIHGMASGQSLDLSGTNTPLTMYELKTGALLIASMKLGAIAANMQDSSILNALEVYAHEIGIAFQLQDDLLDFAQPEETGKPQGQDLQNLKLTYVNQVGIENTRLEIEERFMKGLKAIEPLGSKSELLIELAHTLLQRKK